MSDPLPDPHTDWITSNDVRKRWPRPEELGAPTEDEIVKAGNRASLAAKTVFRDAARELYMAKWRRANKTPWRQLVCDYRATDLVQVEVEVIDDGGQPRAQIVYGDPGLGLMGDAASLFKAVAQLSKALDLIEADAQKKTEFSKTALDAKYEPIRRLKKWAVVNAKSSSKSEAKRLCETMPQDIKLLAKGLEDPVRVIYDAIRKGLKAP